MSNTNEDILKQIQALTQTMNALMAQVKPPAMPFTGEKLEPVRVRPKAVVQVLPTTPLVPVAEEKSTPLASEEKWTALFVASKNMDEFCKYASTQFGTYRKDAREKYRKLAAQPPPAHKVPATGEKPVRATEPKLGPLDIPVQMHRAVMTMDAEARAMLAKKGQVETVLFLKNKMGMSLDVAHEWVDHMVDGHRPVTPRVVAAQEAYVLSIRTPGLPVTMVPPPVVPVTTVIAAPPPEATPLLANALLQGLAAEAKAVLDKDGQIPAIKFIKDKTGMDLLPAKLWVDSIMDIKIPLPPIVLGALQSYLQKSGLKMDQPTLQEQVQTMRKDAVVKAMDPVKAQADKQRKMDIAGDNKSMLVQAARKVARELGVKGPITIDDVTFEMSKTYNVLPVKGKNQNWKGSVFSGGEWVFIGEMPSRQVSSHGRPVGMWALKSWLQDNTLNGKETHISSFVVSRLYSDFKRINPKIELKDCNCYMGDERVAAEIRENIKKSGNRLYEVPVSWIPGAVGALIMPPEPKKML